MALISSQLPMKLHQWPPVATAKSSGVNLWSSQWTDQQKSTELTFSPLEISLVDFQDTTLYYIFLFLPGCAFQVSFATLSSSSPLLACSRIESQTSLSTVTLLVLSSNFRDVNAIHTLMAPKCVISTQNQTFTSSYLLNTSAQTNGHIMPPNELLYLPNSALRAISINGPSALHGALRSASLSAATPASSSLCTYYSHDLVTSPGIHEAPSLTFLQ